MHKKVIIYTVVQSNRFYLKEQKFVNKDIDYVCFSDRNFEVYPWRMEVIEKKYTDIRLNYKWYKLHPHKLFADYEYSLWIDSSIIVSADIFPYIEKYLQDANIALFKHHAGRNCLYEEGKVCIELGLADKDITMRQMEKYKQDGYPENNGLVMTGIIFRKHNMPDVVESMEDWFNELVVGCKRDQVSFNYVAWKNNLRFNYIKEIHTNNHPVFKIR